MIDIDFDHDDHVRVTRLGDEVELQFTNPQDRDDWYVYATPEQAMKFAAAIAREVHDDA